MIEPPLQAPTSDSQEMPLALPVGWLREHLNAPWLAIDADGSCTVNFDTLAVALVPYEMPPGFTMRARVGSAATGDFASTLEALLQANLFADGIGANILGMDAGANIFLTRRFSFGYLNREDFLNASDRFVNQALHWHQQLPRCIDPEPSHG